MHLVINSACSISVGVVPLWGKDEFTRKLGVTEEGSDGWNNIAIVELKAFASNVEILALEGGAPRQHLVDDVVQLGTCSV
jgi:hypothetical protein